MAGGSKPEIKVYFKAAADGGGFADLCAFWRNERGMLSGRLDKSVRAIKIVRQDGSEVVLRPDERGIVDGWFLNARTELAASAAPVRGATHTRRVAAPAAADDFPDDSDIPF